MEEKQISFIGSSLNDLRGMPEGARQDIGKALYRLQLGGWPPDTKPLSRVGPGTFEIRVSDNGQAFRTLFVAKFDDAIYVLHAFEKKTRETPQREVDLAKRRYQDMAVARELGAPVR